MGDAGKRVMAVGWFWVALVLGRGVGLAQANSWTNPVSGYWENPYWSLGVLPGPGQDIMLTNAGFKAVGINPSTRQNYPQTLSVNSITIGSPAYSFNELLLNYFGLGTPLSAGSVSVQSNSTLVALFARLVATNQLYCDGNLIQGASAQIATSNLYVGATATAMYSMTNGTVSASSEYIGTIGFGGNNQTVFDQFGGTNSSASFAVEPASQYNLYGGDLLLSNAVVYGTNFQQGGMLTVTGELTLDQTYILSGGALNAHDIQVLGGYPWSLQQSGGTNSVTDTISLGTLTSYYADEGFYNLSNGVLVASNILVGPSSRFEQEGGSCTLTGGIEVFTDFDALRGGIGSLIGGTLSSPSIDLSFGLFFQSNSTNLVAGTLAGGGYDLQSGLLVTSNTETYAGVTGDYGFFYQWAGGFSQSGGIHRVSNLLTLGGALGLIPYYSTLYFLSGGELSAQNIELDSGAVFQQTGGTLNLPGLLTLSDGDWQCNTGQQQLGTLLLANGTGNFLEMPAGACILRFQDCNGIAWSNAAALSIPAWDGSPAGGGAHQIFFGSSSNGLTPAQLGQIRFVNPDGLTGIYPAAILASGEIVPAHFLGVQRNFKQWSLVWSGSAVLQSATNASGPFRDVAGASPYAISFTNSKAFFRLRQPM